MNIVGAVVEERRVICGGFANRQTAPRTSDEPGEIGGTGFRSEEFDAGSEWIARAVCVNSPAARDVDVGGFVCDQAAVDVPAENLDDKLLRSGEGVVGKFEVGRAAARKLESLLHRYINRVVDDESPAANGERPIANGDCRGSREYGGRHGECRRGASDRKRILRRGGGCDTAENIGNRRRSKPLGVGDRASGEHDTSRPSK